MSRAPATFRFPVRVVNVLGEVRYGRGFENGHSCPFCGGASLLEENSECRNPACEASSWADVASVMERRRQYEERKEREADHTRRMNAMRDANEAYNRLRQEKITGWRQDSADNGVCFECLFRSDGRKRIKHRRADYHEAAA